VRRSKKLIIAAVLAGVLLLASLGGVALAQDNDDDSQPGAFFGALWEKVSVIYEQKTGDTLDQEALKEAFTQAQREVQTEAMQNRLQSMVEEGKITQKQADDYLEWQKAMPEDMPFKFGFGGHGGFRGMGGFRGFGGPCAPAE
jgi:hypothetical protein